MPVRRAGTVDLRVGGRLNQTAHYVGLHTCKRKWLDPVCADASARQSRREISVLIEKAWKIGTVVFGTKTVAHWPGDPLAVLWDGLAVARRAVNDDKTVRRLRAEYGYYGYVRTWETTIGPNGWHPHEHMLMLFAKRLSKAQIEELHAAEFRAWKAGAKRDGLRAPSEKAQDLQRVAGKADASDYISKSHVQFEMAAGTETKTARGESRNHWELLIDCMRHGDPRDIGLWAEFEQASYQRSVHQWSKGLRERFEIDQVAKEFTGTPTTIVTLVDWTGVIAYRRAAVLLLEDTNAAAVAGMERLLRQNPAANDHQLRAASLEAAKAAAVAFCDRYGFQHAAPDHPLVAADRERGFFQQFSFLDHCEANDARDELWQALGLVKGPGGRAMLPEQVERLRLKEKLWRLEDENAHYWRLWREQWEKEELDRLLASIDARAGVDHAAAAPQHTPPPSPVGAPVGALSSPAMPDAERRDHGAPCPRPQRIW